MGTYNHHFDIRDNEHGGHTVAFNNNKRKAKMTLSKKISELTPTQVLTVAEKLKCTPEALAIAIDEFNHPETQRSRGSVTSVAQGPRPCACGCGEMVYSKNIKVQFKQGHDAKLHSRLLKQMRDPKGSPESRASAEESLKEWGWL